jgi:hypothetical protein
MPLISEKDVMLVNTTDALFRTFFDTYQGNNSALQKVGMIK